MSSEQKFNWPEEDPAEGRGYKLPGDESYDSYVLENLAHWKNADRGLFSRPLELLNTSKLLHKKLLKTFDLPTSTEKPLVVFSVLFDDPSSPSSKYVHSERFPDCVKEEDKEAFTIGIGRITEYATNLATKEFFKKNYPRPVSDAYSNLSDWFTYKLLLNGTYLRMQQVEQMAELNRKDYKGAIFSALFQHDFDPINEIIADTKELSGYGDINELAIYLGHHRLKKPDLGKWIGKLDAKKDSQPRLGPIKNLVTSSLAAGAYRNPGVVEISGGAIFVLPAAATAACLIGLEVSNAGIFSHPELMRYTIPAVAASVLNSMQIPVVVVGGLMPFVAVHEEIHHLSSDENYMGMIPAKLIHKETTPYKGKLEPETYEED